MRLRSWIACALLAVSVNALADTPVAASIPAPADRAAEALLPLTDLAAQRVQIADKVAAAKFGASRPIDDPVRERQILDTVAAR